MPVGQVLSIRGQNIGSLAATFSTKPAAGSAIVVLVAGRNTIYDVNYSSSGVTDSAGNTYTKRSFNGNNLISGSEIWVAENVSVPVGSWTVTITCTKTTSQYVSATAIEWVGAATASAFDVQTTGTCTHGATSMTTGTTSALAQSSEVCFAALTLISDDTTQNIVAPTTGWTLADSVQSQTQYCGFGAAYKEVSTTTGVSAAWSFDASTYGGVGSLATLKLASSSADITGDAELLSILLVSLETPASDIAVAGTDTYTITVTDQNSDPALNVQPTVVVQQGSGFVSFSTPAVTDASGVTTTQVTGVSPGTAYFYVSCGGISSPLQAVTVSGGLSSPPLVAIARRFLRI